MTARRSLAALLVLGAVAGCGDDEPQPRNAAATATTPTTKTTHAKPVGIDRAGTVAQFVDCGDWKKASQARRYATIEDIRGQNTPQQSRTAASPLSDERAYAIFQKMCRPVWADSLRLYKIYVRAQAFAPLVE